MRLVKYDVINNEAYSALIYNFSVSPPYSRPGGFSITSNFDKFGNTVLNWTPASNARGYSVLRSKVYGGPFIKITEYLTGTSYVDSEFPFQTNYYKVEAVNGSGRRVSHGISSKGVSTKASKRNKQ